LLWRAPLKTDIENLNDNNVSFSNDELNEFDDLKYHLNEHYVGSVDLSKVKGCTHPDYFGFKWHDLKPVTGTLEGNRENSSVAYQKLKRAISNIKELASNPEYYLSHDLKNYWSFYQVNGDYYIASGVHRTIIARYFLFLNGLPQLVHGVKITKATLKCMPQEKLEPVKLTPFQKVKRMFAI
jgi:hypothetical protein